MLIDIAEKKYKNYFPHDPYPFISEGFINLVKHKADRIVRLIDSTNKDVCIGLVAGIKDNMLIAPFSAPFGGFHYKYEAIFYDRIYDFLLKLKRFLSDEKLDCLEITLSPNIYNPSINAKLVNAFIRLNYTMSIPDIISYIDLRHFDGVWVKSEVRQNCNRAKRNGLSFSLITDKESIKQAYDIILSNREKQGRNVHMTLDEVLEINSVMPVDFFLVRSLRGEGIGAAVLYRGHENIVQGVFVGDVLSARKLGTMDFMFSNLFRHYKEAGFEFIDLGKSSLSGEPNIGLIRFKEIHNCVSTVGYSFQYGNVKP